MKNDYYISSTLTGSLQYHPVFFHRRHISDVWVLGQKSESNEWLQNLTPPPPTKKKQEKIVKKIINENQWPILGAFLQFDTVFWKKKMKLKR